MRYSHLYLKEELKDINIGRGPFHFLIVIYENEGICQEDLSKKLRLDKTTTTRTLHKLLMAGYISKQKNIEDKRMYRVYTSIKGKELIKNRKTIFSSLDKIILSGLTDREKEVLEKLLIRMIQNIIQEVKGDEK
ncbi:MAG TPA: MarR family transcriptional regulator [Methanofastidiosum sp.]|mgnify:FL=1|nr:MarR family transcriptional regulator [Methanofastidiosum sp.]